MDAVAILDVCWITPDSNSPEFYMPITYLDAVWLRLPTSKLLFSYHLADPTQTHFNSVIVPRLKHSLSLTLTHFFPLAGNVVWPSHDPIPSILYRPNDCVSLTIAESNNPESFVHLAGKKPYKATESHFYIPELHATDSESAIVSVQATLFANHGVAIGLNINHAVFDANTFSLFLKAWAHMNKQLSADSSPLLPPELTPFLDRSGVQDPEGLCMKILKLWEELMPSASGRSIMSSRPSDPDPTLVRATFEVSLDDVKKLRDLALSKLGISDAKTQRLSTFVLVYSYTLDCLVKAKKLESLEMVKCLIMAESRNHLNPPLPHNYLGNCLTLSSTYITGELVREKDGFAGIAKLINEHIQEVRNKSVYQVFKDDIPVASPPGNGKVLYVCPGSPRIELYEIDFGWGKPVKVELTNTGRFAAFIAERGDGSGGVEITLVMTADEMEVFDSLFVGGLKNKA